jgi:NADH-quinone oxidoreductase subunit J
MVELIVFLVAGAIVLVGGVFVILSRNPVHAALSLVASLFGIAVLFVAQDAQLLAAVQVIVYTGAIVVLILFVLMLLGVDQAEDVATEPIAGQRPVAVLVGAAGLIGVAAILLLPVIEADPIVSQDAAGEECERDATFEETTLTGERSQLAPITEDAPVEEGASVVPDGCAAAGQPQVPIDDNIQQLGRVLFTDYVFAFEATALLLTIAVVGAVMMARRVRDAQPLPPDPEPIGGPRSPEPEAELVGASAGAGDAAGEAG